MSARTPFAGFPREAPSFLADLAANNARDWFERNRERYAAHVLAPAKQFVAALGARIAGFAPAIRAEPRVNGSILRLNRDTRFSKDKSPYKDWLGLWFWEGEGPSRDCPGFYFKMEASALTLGAGKHMFGPDELESYRRAAADPTTGKALRAVLDAALAGGSDELGGRHYKRVPRGYDPDSPNAGLLLHNGLYVGRSGPLPHELFGPGAVEFCATAYEGYLPLHRWLVANLKS